MKVVSSSALEPARRCRAMYKEKKRGTGTKLEFQMCIKPAQLCIKPLASLANPFRSACSIFCNHPTNNIGLKMAIKKTKRRKLDEDQEAELMGEILEDIICRRGWSVEPVISPEVLPPPRPQLVLNLRRTISQETGRTSVGLQSTFSQSPSSLSGLPKNVTTPSPALLLDTLPDTKSEMDEEDGEVIRRRGKIRKKKRKTALIPEGGDKEVIDLSEPNDTLVSTYDGEGGEHELDEHAQGECPLREKNHTFQATPPLLLNSDIFDLHTLRHLRRSLSTTQVEAEFRKIWRRVLQEALRASDILPKDEIKIAEEVPQPEPETWISYPRRFTRASARFDLPINKALLNDMKPIGYLREYVANSKTNMLIYDYVYKKYKGEDGCLSHEALMTALGDVMGRGFTNEEQNEFQELIDLDENMVDYRTWLGVAALSERFYGEKFSTGRDMDMGKRLVIERVDFESLAKRMSRLNLNPQIARLLHIISSS